VEQESINPLIAERPLGMYTAKVDDKGRVKLPTDFQQYFSQLGHAKFFITSLDRCIAEIYPITVWLQNEEFFASYREDPEKADSVAFNAADLGGRADIDAQGRLLFPAKLRSELGLEDQPIHIFAADQRVEVLSEQVYQEKKRSAKAAGRDAVATLRKAGLK
jgi:MraZ protein